MFTELLVRPHHDLLKVSFSSCSLLSPLSVSGPVPACDRVGDCYVKPVPEHKSSSLIAQLLCSLTASCSPSAFASSPQSISSSSLPHVPVKTDLPHPRPCPRPHCENMMSNQSFSILNKRQREQRCKLFRSPKADGCFISHHQMKSSIPEMSHL